MRFSGARTGREDRQSRQSAVEFGDLALHLIGHMVSTRLLFISAGWINRPGSAASSLKRHQSGNCNPGDVTVELRCRFTVARACGGSVKARVPFSTSNLKRS